MENSLSYTLQAFRIHSNAFGLTNVPATFQNFINDSIFDYLDMFCTAYLDDILCYSDTLEEYQDISFGWTPKAQAAFNAFKGAFTTVSIFINFDLEKEITVETNVSDYVSDVDSPNMMIMVPFDPSHTSQKSTSPPNATTRFMTKFYWRSFDHLKNGDWSLRDISHAECTEVECRLLYRGSIYVPYYNPLKLRILKLYHDALSAGHSGREKTFELISRHYYWPLMRNYIARYVWNCHTCQRSKPNTYGKLRVLRLLPIPEQRWQEVSMDFINGLPESEGYDAIMVIVDRLTKRRHFQPCNTTVNSKDVAEL
ncbi:uncharacterized protein H6S33_004128 [Morchella sextelata]|uniref:uncharacterized protein n=1 Tax=Morchella sextelata TaxID=1174677 RepID=UPI001D04FF5E|nr:uncharacterized protein H6S33_004128 [Morchella sextelata]KAH0606467.1 hypothetical protein H6S33_004128 [Morchella sextelata]